MRITIIVRRLFPLPGDAVADRERGGPSEGWWVRVNPSRWFGPNLGYTGLCPDALTSRIKQGMMVDDRPRITQGPAALSILAAPLPDPVNIRAPPHR